MSTNAILRGTIKALCAPAVLAMLASHVPVAQADVIARDQDYSYNSPGFSGTSTFSFHVLKNDAVFFDPQTEGRQFGPLVEGSPQPLQLVSAAVGFSEEGVIPTVSRFRNCIMVSVAGNPNQSGSSGIFSITYTVADASGGQGSGELTFFAGEGNSFNDEPMGSDCDDPQFQRSVAQPDPDNSTPANTPLDIDVLENDQVGGPIFPVLTTTVRPTISETTFPTATVTVNGTATVTVAGTSQKGGTVRANADGTVTYTPAQGFSGTDTFDYTIQDYTEKGFEDLNSSATVTVTVAAPPPENQAIIVFKGMPVANQSTLAIADTDNTAGETALFDGSQTTFGDGVRPNRFQWFVNDQLAQDSQSATFQTQLNDGTSAVTLIATANDGDFEFARATSSISVTVAPPSSMAAITVNGTAVADGGTISLTDTDAKLGEIANFDGSQTQLSGGVQPTRFQWFVNDVMRQDGASATFQVGLDENTTSAVRLIASNGQLAASSSVNVTVALTLANIQNLTPNQRQVALALDRICNDLLSRLDADPTLTADQQDLRQRCQGILAAAPGDQVRALDELGAQDFNGARLQTLLFTNSLYAGVQDRLMALRGGAKGLSLAGLNVIIDGKSVPLAQLSQMVGQMLGGGAAADEPGSLLGDKWGAWSRGNFTFGEKDRSRNDKGFEADQFSLTAGLDYRLTDKMVIGGALAYGSSNLDYNPSKEGGLDTKQWAVSIYGSSYAGKNFYLDAVVNAANSSYEADRRITYNEAFDTGGGVLGTRVVQRQAKGDTDGFTLSGGLSGGYDFIYKGLTLSPNLGVFYVDSTIDKFREKRSQGLNLIYDEQSFQSLTGTLGFRVNYAWNLSWGVLVPYVRGDYVREFNQDVEAFNVHFASDPADPAPPIVVQSDDPDESYVRLVGGLSGQFPFGISGYIEYQRLQSFEFVNFNDLSMGLRVQYRY